MEGEELSEGGNNDALLEAAEYDVLIGLDVADILREGQKALFGRLVAAVRAGTASHQQQAILRNILKDNGMTLGIPPETGQQQVREEMPLPEFDDENE